MAVITESALRTQLKSKTATVYAVNKGDKLTPSASEYLKTKGIELIYSDDERAVNDKVASKGNEAPVKSADENKISKKYVCYYTGAWFSEKPEFMTQIEGNKLVFKDHQRIAFRGKLDSTEAQALYTLSLIDDSKKQIKAGLKEIYLHLRKMMRAEVLGEHLEEFSMLSMDQAQLRELSHNPKKYFGNGHFILTGEEDKDVLLLNILRTRLRELEIEGLRAFRKENTVDRKDIMMNLNRLSSAVYVLMLKATYEK